MVSVSCGCHDKLLQTWQAISTQIYFLIVPRARNSKGLKPRCCQIQFFLDNLGETISLSFLVFKSCLPSLAVISSSYHIIFLPLLLSSHCYFFPLVSVVKSSSASLYVKYFCEIPFAIKVTFMGSWDEDQDAFGAFSQLQWRRKWQPTPLFLPGESHGQRSLAGYSPWGHKEQDTTEVTEHEHVYSAVES